MIEFIKYCFYCFLMAISAAFGNNPEGMTFKNIIIGIITMFGLLGLLLLLLYLVGLIVNRFRRKAREPKLFDEVWEKR